MLIGGINVVFDRGQPRKRICILVDKIYYIQDIAYIQVCSVFAIT